MAGCPAQWNCVPASTWNAGTKFYENYPQQNSSYFNIIHTTHQPEGKRPLGRPRRRWMDNIMIDLQEVGCGYMDWIGLAQDRDGWLTLVNAVMNLRVPWNAGNFLTSCKPVSFSRRTLHHGVSIPYTMFCTIPLVTNCHYNELGILTSNFLRVCTVHQWRLKHFIIQQMHKYIIRRYS